MPEVGKASRLGRSRNTRIHYVGFGLVRAWVVNPKQNRDDTKIVPLKQLPGSRGSEPEYVWELPGLQRPIRKVIFGSPVRRVPEVCLLSSRPKLAGP